MSKNSSDLRDACFNVSNMSHVQMIDVDGRNADFRLCDFSHALLIKSDFEGAVMWGADFRGTNLHESNLKHADLEDAQFDEDTTLPDGYRWTPNTDISRYTDPYVDDFWYPTDDTWLHYDDDSSPPWWLRGQIQFSKRRD
ncbi:MAG: pentapeptide repeat-containing protein [Chloroflexota bacterium]